ncbi:MAG: hypothetical protein RJB50_1048, partial [Actinomycetota bacterium]
VRTGRSHDVESAVASRSGQLGDQVLVATVIVDLHGDANGFLGLLTHEQRVVVVAPGVHGERARGRVDHATPVTGCQRAAGGLGRTRSLRGVGPTSGTAVVTSTRRGDDGQSGGGRSHLEDGAPGQLRTEALRGQHAQLRDLVVGGHGCLLAVSLDWLVFSVGWVSGSSCRAGFGQSVASAITMSACRAENR